jgi:hypothetical protein
MTKVSSGLMGPEQPRSAKEVQAPKFEWVPVIFPVEKTSIAEKPFTGAFVAARASRVHPGFGNDHSR